MNEDRMRDLRASLEKAQSQEAFYKGQRVAIEEELVRESGFSRETGSETIFGLIFNRPKTVKLDQSAVPSLLEVLTPGEFEAAIRTKYEPVLAGIETLRKISPEKARYVDAITSTKPGKISVKFAKDPKNGS